ncbi:MAG: threonine--tRNA ligase [Rhodobacteraceae bacterium]|nr:threonine--tRNA ligase [Paracoccaceae bacterium]
MPSTITITFPDGSSRDHPCGVTARELAAGISPSLAKKAISAHVNGVHWDLGWPIEGDAGITINTMADEHAALELIRHDLAHVMARAVQELWPETRVTIGPVIENGWYYDFDRAESFTPDDLAIIEKRMRKIINAADPVRSEIWSRGKAIAFYRERGENYKVELVEAIPDGEAIRMYWHGRWQDLCRGPHLQNTGQLPGDSFRLQSIAGAFWRGDPDRPMLQRIYGIGFRRRNDLKQHLKMLEEAQKRDHRRLGKSMDLFHFQEEAPGMPFWHPDGWTIYSELRSYMARKQKANGYREVNTPLVVDRTLWEQSGHWDKFHEHMYLVNVDEKISSEGRISALKPMNCPCHVQIFNARQTSYRELPMRIAEFGSCTRYEPSGALHGLLRVRGFVQDDAHIFCEESQIEAETARFIALLSEVYADLGFTSFKVKFSDRPDIRAGDDTVWDKAEEALEAATNAAGCSYELNPGEGAFYGPKLEFVLTDAIGRDWQCGTLQVDFVMPARLGALYVGQDGVRHHPVILHRAILGSFERFIGILIENYSGSLPLWLAPKQAVVATIVSTADTYAETVLARLRDAGIRAEGDMRNEKINYKVRMHSLAKVPYILAVGEKEVENGTVSLRTLGSKTIDVLPVDAAVSRLAARARPPDTA